MNKYFLLAVCLIATLLAGCKKDTPVSAPEPLPAVVVPSHACSNVCPACDLCLNLNCTDSACMDKCAGHQEEPYAFPQGDFITDSSISITCEDMVFDIGPGIYVPGSLAVLSDLMTSAIEEAAGLSFEGSGYAEAHSDGKIHANVSRDNLYTKESWYQGLESSELGTASAGLDGTIQLSPGDLFLGSDYAFAHEMSHLLMYRQTGWFHCQLLDEGFAEYTAYLALKSMEQIHPNEAPYFGSSTSHIYNMEIFDYDKLFEQDVEYWFENTFEYSSNANYTIGFRFMWYLHDVYGDYSSWLLEIENQHPFRSTPWPNNNADVEWMLDALKTCYGEDVLDGFYPWLRENLALFDMNAIGWSNIGGPADQWHIDRTGASGINWYPQFNGMESRVYLNNLVYQDLYINLETVRTYLSDYKGIDISGLTLSSTQPVTVRLYQANGSNQTVLLKEPIPLENTAYIKLVGQGEVPLLTVSGFEGEVLPYYLSEQKETEQH